MMEKDRKGQCLCGAVRLYAGAQHTDLGVCHCANCRVWSGGPLFEIECENDVSFEGAENISTYCSSKHAERGFCKICGTHLYVKDFPSGAFGIPPGLFENTDGIEFFRQVFIDHKPSYYSFSNKTQTITSAYIYEHYPETRNDT